MDINQLTREIASRRLDFIGIGAFGALPNPDPVLRRLGVGWLAYESISYDAHVISELRPIRAALLKHEHRVNPGGESAADLRAAEICELVLQRRPGPKSTWGDVWWSMQQAVFMGYAVHELIWERVDGLLLPQRVIDREQRRFDFDVDEQLLLRAPGSQPLILDTAHKWLLTRHMPSAANPYGYALFSAVFWPWTFKHNAVRFWSKGAERFSAPFTVGRYPPGTSQDDQNKLADALAEMLENAVAAIPEGSSIELVSSGTTMAASPAERLAKFCNSEISKALSSQTLATEIQGEGSRAASQTHAERGEGVANCDRNLVISTMNDLFASVTELNVAGAVPPTFEFFEEEEARSGWAETLEKARHYVQIPAWFAHERLQIPLPEAGDDVLPAGEPSAAQPPAEFARRQRNLPSEEAVEELLDAVTDEQLQAVAEDVVGPLIDLIRSDGPRQALQTMADQYSNMNTVQLQKLLSQVMFVADTWGRLMSQTRDTDGDA